MSHATLAVIGAGAAGSFAAMFAARALKEAQSAASVVVFETRRQPGAKIRVSGGGRCNVLPGVACLQDFETRGSEPVIRNILASWPLADVRHFFEADLGLALKDEPSGKVFPQSDSSRDVVEQILRGVSESGARLEGSAEVRTILSGTDPTKPRFSLTLADKTTITCDRLIVATGGLSMPRTGSDGHGLGLLRQLGHRVEVTAPALVPLVGLAPWGSQLSGVTLVCRLRATQQGRVLGQTTGSVLFTHRGISGPCALDISRFYTLAAAEGGGAASSVQIEATWGRASSADDPKQFYKELLAANAKTAVGTLLRAELPKRLAEALLYRAALEGRESQPISSLTRQEHQSLLKVLIDMPLGVLGSEGYRVAECTTGGVALKEIAWRTLESRRTPGLHLCGEVLDVTGRLGGFNFLWAWVSGRKAGLAAARAILDTPATKTLSLAGNGQYASPCTAHLGVAVG